MAFFRQIFDEVGANYPDISKAYNYVDAAALDLIRSPWSADVMVMENMFGDILSDLAGGLVGGMILDAAIETGFALNQLRPMEFGGDMGTKAITLTVSSLMDGKLK